MDIKYLYVRTAGEGPGDQEVLVDAAHLDHRADRDVTQQGTTAPRPSSALAKAAHLWMSFEYCGTGVCSYFGRIVGVLV